MEQISRPPSSRWLLLLIALLWALGIPGLSHAADEKRVHVDLQAGSAAIMLNEWSRQTDYSVSTNFDTALPLKTQAVKGFYEPIEALKLMLAPTGLTFEFVNDRFVSVYPREEARVAEKVRAPPPAKRPRTPVNRLVAHAKPELNEEVTVTGTRIPQTKPVGTRKEELGRVDIEEGGFPSLEDLLQSRTYVFGGGPTEDTEIDAEARTNSGRGSGVNVRGLGAGSALVLFNGFRLAPGGSEGAFVDVTSIPQIAIEQVDIMADGASALYGTDAVGGVVNVVTRRNFRGAESQLRTAGLGGGSSRRDRQFAQILGREWSRLSGVLALEYLERDALAADDRELASSDLRRFGGDDFRSVAASPGTIALGPMTFAIPAGQDGRNLTPADLIPGTSNQLDRLAMADLLPRQERWSGYGNLRAELGDFVELSADALITNRRAIGSIAAVSATLPVFPGTPFYIEGLLPPNAPIPVAYSFIRDLGPILGDANVRTSNFALGLSSNRFSWNVSANVGYALEEQRQTLSNLVNFPVLLAALLDPNADTAFNLLGGRNNPATIDAIRDSLELNTHSQVTTANLTTSGALFSVTGGDAKLALGVETRRQSFAATIETRTPSDAAPNDSGRDIHAVFGELNLPLVSDFNDRRGLRKLDVSLAVRAEDYSDFGTSTTPRVGLAWAPSRGLSFRGTWSESMRAPKLFDLNEVNNVLTVFPFASATAPGGVAQSLVWSGGNRDLKEERAKSWTLGMDFQPIFLPALSLSLTYFDVTFKDRVAEMQPTDFDFLNDPRLSQLVTLNPTLEDLERVCSRARLTGITTVQCASQPVAAIVDLRAHNATYLRTNGFDAYGDYSFESRWGRFKLGLLGTYLLEYAEAPLQTLPVVDLKSTQNHPVDLRLRGSASWRQGPLAASAFVSYTDSYRDTLSDRRIGSWTTLDLNLAYTLGDPQGPNTRLSIGVDNLCDSQPPFLNNRVGRIGYDAENGDLTGRLVSFQIRQTW